MPGEVESVARKSAGSFRVTSDSDLPFIRSAGSFSGDIFLILSQVSREARAAAEIAHSNPCRSDFRSMPPLHVFCASRVTETGGYTARAANCRGPHCLI